MPKICAPIVGRSMEEICRQAEDVKKARPDMVEWRMDFMDGIEEEQIQSEALKRVSELLDGLPLLCTFRTKAEGSASGIHFLYIISLLLKKFCPFFVGRLICQICFVQQNQSGFIFSQFINIWITTG